MQAHLLHDLRPVHCQALLTRHDHLNNSIHVDINNNSIHVDINNNSIHVDINSTTCSHGQYRRQLRESLSNRVRAAAACSLETTRCRRESIDGCCPQVCHATARCRRASRLAGQVVPQVAQASSLQCTDAELLLPLCRSASLAPGAVRRRQGAFHQREPRRCAPAQETALEATPTRKHQ